MKTVARRPMRAGLPGRELVGWVEGSGPPVLLLHGGPGLSYDYLDEVAAEIGGAYEVAAFQQRGLAPSTVEGPFTVGQAVEDVVAVLDAVGWEKAYVVGHSWGGHLILHMARSIPERMLGGLAVDPLGGVADGGMAAMAVAMDARISDESRRKVKELGERSAVDGWNDESFLESLRLVWPAYYASPAGAPPLPAGVRVSVAAYGGLFASINEEMAGLAGSLAAVRVPLGFVAGGASPLPADQASAATAAVVPGAWLSVVPEGGHLPWYERPGCVRAGLERLVG
jgi:pimeloyl-ACP methyl ester carboxylesterase